MTERIQPDKITELRDKIDKRAYSKWKERGKIHGLDLQDHLEAEKEIIREEVIRETPHHYGMDIESLDQSLEELDSEKNKTPETKRFQEPKRPTEVKVEREQTQAEKDLARKHQDPTPQPEVRVEQVPIPVEIPQPAVASEKQPNFVHSSFGYYEKMDEENVYVEKKYKRLLRPIADVDDVSDQPSAPSGPAIATPENKANGSGTTVRPEEPAAPKPAELGTPAEKPAELPKPALPAETPKPDEAPKPEDTAKPEEPKPEIPEAPKPSEEGEKPEAPKPEEAEKQKAEDEQKRLDDMYKKGVEDGKEELWKKLKRPKSIMEKIKTLFRRHPKEPKTDVEKVEKYKRDIYRTVVLGGVASALTTLLGVGMAQYFFGHFLIPWVNKIPELIGNRVDFK